MLRDVHAHQTGLLHRAFAVGAVAAILLVGMVWGPALAVPTAGDPSNSQSGSSSSQSAKSGSSSQTAPSIDSAAPTPTSPPATGVPQGNGPDGVTIGGPELDTQGRVVYDGAPALPNGLNTHGLVLADLGTGEILAAQDPHGKYYPASTLKALTFIALYPHLDPNQVLTATYEDATVEGSRVGLVEHGNYTVAQLWTALMLQSGNDAARMLSTAVGGEEKSLALMNEKAVSLQAYDTLAGTTSGLDIAGQSSSPYDLALFMREIINDPALRTITSQPLGQLPPQPPKYPQPLSFGNQNQLLLSYPGTIAGKTGFTDAARHTFVAAAERNGRTLVVSLMQSEHTPLPTWKQAAALLDWGFAAPPSVTGAGRLVLPDEVSPAPTEKSDAAQAAANGSAATSARAAASADHRDSWNEIGAWALVPVLGGLLAVAVRVAAPRGNHRR